MVPEGLVLLTSLAFGLATVSLARRQTLVQELPAVEGLASTRRGPSHTATSRSTASRRWTVPFGRTSKRHSGCCPGRRMPTRPLRPSLPPCGRPPGGRSRRCPSLLRANGPPRSPRNTAHGCSARRRWCSPRRPRLLVVRPGRGPNNSQVTAVECSCSPFHPAVPHRTAASRRCRPLSHPLHWWCSPSALGQMRRRRCATSPNRACA
jgi:hypothetical protein